MFTNHKFIHLLATLLCIFSLVSCANHTPNNVQSKGENSQKLNATQTQFYQLLDEIWQYEITQFPSMARSQGVPAKELTRQFTDTSLPAMAARHDRFVIFRSNLDALDAKQLNESEKITLMMQAYRLDNQISQFKYI